MTLAPLDLAEKGQHFSFHGRVIYLTKEQLFLGCYHFVAGIFLLGKEMRERYSPRAHQHRQLDFTYTQARQKSPYE